MEQTWSGDGESRDGHLRVGLIAPPWVPVPPAGYGGTEGVVDSLARGLARRGHDVVLFTTGDASCPVPRRWVFDRAPAQMNASMSECRHVQAAYETLTSCDLIHDHTTLGPIWARASGVRTPLVVTMHNPFTVESRPVMGFVARHAHVVAISHDHRATAPDVDVAAVIHHGLDAEQFSVGAGSGGYALFLGRFAPEKGVLDAIRIARLAGVPLVLAAKMRSPEERAYFTEVVQPELDDGARYVGEVGPLERDTLLRDATALVNPIAWSEPFGLVMIEAMACGTPVVAYPNGAAPEIVRDGVTGFLVADPEAGAHALSQVGTLDRGACRAAVCGYFSADRMVDQYEDLYRRVVAAGDAGRTA